MAFPEPTLEQRAQMTTDFAQFTSKLSYTMLILSPILIALPPRKLDLYTFTLAASFAASANQISRERTGMGLWGHMPFTRGNFERISPRAETFREETRQRRLLDDPTSAPVAVRQLTKLEEPATQGWKERRLREEQEKIQEGEGYGSMIMEQIWDVWNWGKTGAERLKEKDEAVLQKRERE